MPKTRRDVRFQTAFGKRLDTLVEQHLLTAWDALATELGYRTASVLLKAKRGTTCLSAEKLALLASVVPESSNHRVSVDWLLTGKGSPLLASDKAVPSINRIAMRVQNAAPKVQRQVEGFLDVTLSNDQAGASAEKSDTSVKKKRAKKKHPAQRIRARSSRRST